MAAQAPSAAAYPAAPTAPSVSVQQGGAGSAGDLKSQQQVAAAALAVQQQQATGAAHNVTMPLAHAGAGAVPQVPGVPATAFAYPPNMVFTAPDPGLVDDQPTYVNPKQYARILKRRESRKKQTGTDVTSYTPRKRSYMHESRHKHAMQRRRGPGGRFLSKQERADLDKEAEKNGNNGNTVGVAGATPGVGSKPGETDPQVIVAGTDAPVDGATTKDV